MKLKLSEVAELYRELEEKSGLYEVKNVYYVQEGKENYVVLRMNIHYSWRGRYDPYVTFTVFHRRDDGHYDRVDFDVAIYDLLNALKNQENLITPNFVLVWKEDMWGKKHAVFWIPIDSKLVKLELDPRIISAIASISENLIVLAEARSILEVLRRQIQRSVKQSDVYKELVEAETKCRTIHKRRTRRTIEIFGETISLCRECYAKHKDLIDRIPEIEVEIDDEYYQSAKKLVEELRKRQ